MKSKITELQPTELRAFAERILFSKTLTEKLAPAGLLIDSTPGVAIITPEHPGRPPELRMEKTPGRSLAHFPKPQTLDRGNNAAQALHFFANHELMALEIMALAILKFPEAPSAFRRGLIGTIGDEQAHIQMYITRMQALGLSFGELAVNDYFWAIARKIETPQQYLSQLCLTFEQANLDFSRYYGERYREIGDTETARTLDVIYRDEIRHVRYGLTWIRRMSPSHSSDLEAHRAHLIAPITLHRAKGYGFNREGRRAAGLDDAYIDALAQLPEAERKARTVYEFVPDSELAASRAGQPLSDKLPPLPRALGRLRRDLQLLPLVYADQHAIIMCEHLPRPIFVNELAQAGLPQAQFVMIPQHAHTTLTAYHTLDGSSWQEQPLQGPLRDFRPWGLSTASIFRARNIIPFLPKGHNLRSETPPALPDYGKGTALHALRLLHQRLPEALRSIVCNEHDVGVVVSDLHLLLATIAGLRSRGIGNIIIKGTHASSGREQLRLRDTHTSFRDAQAPEKLLAANGALVVEPLLDRVLDFSIHLDILSPGRIKFLGTTRFATNDYGKYLGSFIGKMDQGLPSSLSRGLYQGGASGLKQILRLSAEAVAETLAPSRYTGPVGIDALLYRSETGLRLKPIVEINPRYTMGRVALALQRLCAPHSFGVFAILPKILLAQKDNSSFSAIARALQKHFPLHYAPVSKKIVSGLLCLSDSQEATDFLAVALFANSYDTLQEIIHNTAEFSSLRSLVALQTP